MMRIFAVTSVVIVLAFGVPWGQADVPSPGLRVRQPAAQGGFYPADEAKLTMLVDSLLMQPPAKIVSGRIRAIIAPHAGYRYSGIVAAQGFRQIPDRIKRVVVMAPAHHVHMRGGGSILDVDVYRNALGDVPLDPAAAQLRKENGFFASLPKAHAREHSLEVMLPFLQRRLSSFTLVPIVLGQELNPARIADVLLPLVDDEDTFLVASSDLSHDKSYGDATTADLGCVEAILRLDTFPSGCKAHTAWFYLQ